MTKNEFKQGDKVATTKCYDISIYGCSTRIPIGEEGEIEDIDGDELYVYFSGYSVYLTIPISDVELIQPLDRRTAFLTELQTLLRKYDAKICGGLTDRSEKDLVFILIGDNDKDKIKYLNGAYDTYAQINADNIMNFDKE